MGLKYQNIHTRQLFNWVGRHIDYETSEPPHPNRSRKRKTKITEGMREAYLECLAGTLENGLWSKPPSEPDKLGDGTHIKITAPITCFTEWSLVDSFPHAYKYGRLGFGFSKNWVFLRGGRPVSYVRPVLRQDPFNTALLKLAAHFKGDNVDAGLSEAFHFITQFIKKAKRDQFDRETTSAEADARIMPPATAHADAALPKPAKRSSPEPLLPQFKRRFGGNLEYLEEREWRIVYHSKLARHFSPGPEKSGEIDRPQFYLKFRPGSDLLTVVLPDNRTVHKLLHERRDLVAKLLTPDAPHVTLLSLEDIGTF